MLDYFVCVSFITSSCGLRHVDVTGLRCFIILKMFLDNFALKKGKNLYRSNM